jgi:tetratricopeptide (TPR) repeat protein
VSNFFFLSGVLVSERALYLPSVGFALAAGWVLDRLRRERRAMAWAVTGAVTLLMGYRTWIRNPEWRDNLTVFDVMVRDHPESGRAQWVLGDTYYSLGNMDRALDAYRIAVGLLGTEYPLLTQIATRLSMSDQPRQAEVLLRFAWDEMPELGQAPGLLAMVLSLQERYEEAEQAARAALEGGETPDPIIHHILARSLAVQGRYREAIVQRREVIRLGEDHPDQWRWLAELYAAEGDTARALEALDSARIRIRSRDQMRQIDSLRAGLEGGERASESANSLQNPRAEGSR